MITRRLRRGREHKAQLGGYAHGAPPFGYRPDSGRLVPDPEEQRAVLKMIEMRDSGSSLRDIAAYLNDVGVPSKRGGRWHPQTVARVLRSTDAYQVV
jgi:DNA invertase Pin-like site-specific DNA recombinase